MNNEFQTTFIPKKPLSTPGPTSPLTNRPPSRPIGFFTLFALLIFLVTTGIGVWTYFDQQSLIAERDALIATIRQVEQSFDREVLADITREDRRLASGMTLLNNHQVLSPFFNFLGTRTIPEVRFSEIEFLRENNVPKVRMRGEALSYTAIAQQAQLLSEGRVLRDVIFSEFAVNRELRQVFTLTFVLDESLVNFDQMIESLVPPPVNQEELFEMSNDDVEIITNLNSETL